MRQNPKLKKALFTPRNSFLMENGSVTAHIVVNWYDGSTEQQYNARAAAGDAFHPARPNADENMPETSMDAYWQDCEDVVESSHPHALTLNEALNRWADISGAEGNFFGLIDVANNTMQFYFEDSIPDEVEDASHLEIVLVDFPQPSLGGSYQKLTSVGESTNWIKRGFELGLDYKKHEGLKFAKW